MLHVVLEKLRTLANGSTAISKTDEANTRMYPTSPIMTRVAQHLNVLLQIQTEIVDLNFRRRHAIEHQSKIQYGIGDIVKHTKYNFRGVVLSWDAQPVMDVRRWDGVQDIDNVMEKPFYQVIPDQNDCIQAFGGPRPIRYVCQDNLEPCPSHEAMNLNVNVEPDWILRRRPQEEGDNNNDTTTTTTTTTVTSYYYEAPQTIQYSFGNDLKDDGVTERCLQRIQDELNSLFLLARQDNPTDELANHLSIQKLFAFLQLVDNAKDAHVVQELLKEYRKAHCRRELCWRLYTGIPELLNGKVQNAMEIYKQVVREDPTFAEGWNRLATCQYISGMYEESRKSTDKALELDPYHLQAISGSGLLYYEAEDYEAAAKCFRQALSLDPWLGVGSKLSQTLDLLDNIIIREELD
jgi:hemimethylated DNA binding protein